MHQQQQQQAAAREDQSLLWQHELPNVQRRDQTLYMLTVLWEKVETNREITRNERREGQFRCSLKITVYNKIILQLNNKCFASVNENVSTMNSRSHHYHSRLLRTGPSLFQENQASSKTSYKAYDKKMVQTSMGFLSSLLPRSNAEVQRRCPAACISLFWSQLFVQNYHSCLPHSGKALAKFFYFKPFIVENECLSRYFRNFMCHFRKRIMFLLCCFQTICRRTSYLMLGLHFKPFLIVPWESIFTFFKQNCSVEMRERFLFLEEVE